MKTYLSFYIVVLISIIYMGSMFCASGKSRHTSNRLAFGGFNVQDVDAETKRKAEEKLVSALVDRMGTECKCILYRDNALPTLSANKQMVGMLGRMNKGFMISVRVLDGKQGAVLYNTVRTVAVPEDMDKTLEMIAFEISRSDTIWK